MTLDDKLPAENLSLAQVACANFQETEKPPEHRRAIVTHNVDRVVVRDQGVVGIAVRLEARQFCRTIPPLL